MKVCKYQAISAIIIVFFAIAVILLMFWPYMWEGEFLNKWASAIAILSLVGVPIAYFSNQDKKEKERKQKEIDERNLASRNLYGELQDAQDSLDRAKYPEEACSFKIEGDGEVFFMNRDLNHDFYDSMIFSGRINFLKHELQQKVQDVFKRIKTHNNYLTLVMNMQDDEENNAIPIKAHKYYKWMDKTEVRLLQEIPDIMKKLKEDFNI